MSDHYPGFDPEDLEIPDHMIPEFYPNHPPVYTISPDDEETMLRIMPESQWELIKEAAFLAHGEHHVAAEIIRAQAGYGTFADH